MLPSSRSSLSLAVVTAACLLAACGGGSSNPATPAPEFRLQSTATRVELGDAVTLSTDIAAGATGLSYAWDFGDGSSSAQPTVSKTYATSGVYSVRLTITGTDGSTSSRQTQVSVGRYSLTRDRLCTADAAGGWCRLTRLPDTGPFDPVFADERHGWSLGRPDDYDSARGVLRTADGGVTWALHRTAGMQPDALRFADADRGVAIVRQYDHVQQVQRVALVSSSDGGLTWQQRADLPEAFGTILHVDAAGRIVLASGFSSDLLVSEDDGRAWRRVAVPQWQAQASSTTVSPSGALYVRFPGALFRSSDLGRTFDRVLTADSGTVLLQAVFVGAADGWVLGSSNGFVQLWRSTDGGLGWQSRSLGIAAPASVVPPALYADGRTLWLTAPVTSTQALLLRSTDGGDTLQSLLEATTAADPFGSSPAWFQAVSGRVAIVRPGSACDFSITRDGGASWTPKPRDMACVGKLVPVGPAASSLLAQLSDGWWRSDATGNWSRVLALQAATTPLGESPWLVEPRRTVGLSAGAVVQTSDSGGRWSPTPASDALAGLAIDAIAPGRTTGLARALVTVDVAAAGAAPQPTLTVAETRDGGSTWQRIATLPALAESATAGVRGRMVFVDDQRGWILRSAGDHVSLLATEDGGRSWQLRGTPPFRAASSLAFADARIGAAAAYDGVLYQTEDGGATWQPRTTVPTTGVRYPAEIKRIRFVDAAVGHAVGRNQVALRTEDGGRTWAPMTLPAVGAFAGAQVNLNDVAFADARQGWIVGDEGRIVATTDGGRTWTDQASGSLRNFRAVATLDTRTAWAVTEAGDHVVTATGGR
ncbi:YCF48-related protein [Piscinibacter sakaiensis]|uniref:Glycosyl hydrolase, BNR repeat n=1 Tax=Piscinibacter sakaiensis TaxID=1547922 RepID=A0A0K8P1U4_PISS1|nr:YCF48-related protein [Piscinibacter sakaiensis]GAP36140.1 glycosyl hydrolase, BNR repeat [Piscinibacter sakaiensis]